jgi:CII-binding regulator of phage lambda lysogenization HflD
MVFQLAAVLAAVDMTLRASNIVTTVVWGAVQIRKWYKDGHNVDASMDDMIQSILQQVPAEMKQRYGIDSIANALKALAQTMNALHQGKEANMKAGV